MMRMNLMNTNTMNLSNILAEDTGMMELRNPKISGMRKQGWIRRLFDKH